MDCRVKPGNDAETWPLVILLAELAQRRLGDLLGRNAEVPIKVLVRAACAEAVHPDEHAVRADDRVPALTHRGLDGNVDFCLADHRAARWGICGEQQLETRHRHDTRRNTALPEQ